MRRYTPFIIFGPMYAMIIWFSWSAVVQVDAPIVQIVQKVLTN